MSKAIPLVEMFGPTIQGEGAVIGQQTYFLRFGLCDYKCTMCDSMHAVDPAEVKARAVWLEPIDIYDLLADHRNGIAPSSTKWVTFSGGNPCIHNLQPLVDKLRENGWKIAVETQGTFSPDWLLEVDVLTVSPKGPGMGEVTKLPELDDFIFANLASRAMNVKVVVFDQRDLEFAKMLFERYTLLNKWLSPSQYYLSLGNPFPPSKALSTLPLAPDIDKHRTLLLDSYNHLLPDIMNDAILSQMKFLPQWHVLVWGNKQGV